MSKRTEDPQAEQKKSVYFPFEMLTEMKAEAKRLDRSFSSILRMAWKLAKPQLAKLPSTPRGEGDQP